MDSWWTGKGVVGGGLLYLLACLNACQEFQTVLISVANTGIVKCWDPMQQLASQFLSKYGDGKAGMLSLIF